MSREVDCVESSNFFTSVSSSCRFLSEANTQQGRILTCSTQTLSHMSFTLHAVLVDLLLLKGVPLLERSEVPIEESGPLTSPQQRCDPLTIGCNIVFSPQQLDATAQGSNAIGITLIREAPVIGALTSEKPLFPFLFLVLTLCDSDSPDKKVRKSFVASLVAEEEISLPSLERSAAITRYKYEWRVQLTPLLQQCVSPSLEKVTLTVEAYPPQCGLVHLFQNHLVAHLSRHAARLAATCRRDCAATGGSTTAFSADGDDELTPSVNMSVLRALPPTTPDSIGRRDSSFGMAAATNVLDCSHSFFSALEASISKFTQRSAEVVRGKVSGASDRKRERSTSSTQSPLFCLVIPLELSPQPVIGNPQ